jgi:hypothetical protein
MAELEEQSFRSKLQRNQPHQVREPPMSAIQSLFKQCCHATKIFNRTLQRQAQDRRFRFQQIAMFHQQGPAHVEDDKWNYFSDDDDVLLEVDVDGIETYAMANIEEIIVMNQAPISKVNLTAGNALRAGTQRDRVHVDFEPNKVAMLMRVYQEVDGNGNTLTGYQNRDHAHYLLPSLLDAPLDYWLSESVLGHVRLKPLEVINRRRVERMYTEVAKSDREDLLKNKK